MKFATLALLATVAYAQDEAPADDAAAEEEGEAPAAPECAEECAEEESCGIKTEGVDADDEGTAGELGDALSFTRRVTQVLMHRLMRRVRAYNVYSSAISSISFISSAWISASFWK